MEEPGLGLQQTTRLPSCILLISSNHAKNQKDICLHHGGGHVENSPRSRGSHEDDGDGGKHPKTPLGICKIIIQGSNTTALPVEASTMVQAEITQMRNEMNGERHSSTSSCVPRQDRVGRSHYKRTGTAFREITTCTGSHPPRGEY